MREDMKTQISEAFSQLLEKVDIDKITVTRLIEECHISRQTFYYHFHDIMDVLEWTFKHATQILVQKSLEAPDQSVALMLYMNFIKQHQNKFKRLVESKKWFQIEGMMVEAVTAYLENMAKNTAPDLEISYDDMQVMLRFYACGIVGVLIHCMEDKAVNEERLIHQIDRIITGKMFPGKHE